jgi:acylphosphatase
MSEQRTLHLSIRGRVQGVGFRAFVADQATLRNLRGWVRNRRDGSVEAVVAGPAKDVDAFVEALRRGPPAALVQAVDVEPAHPATSRAQDTRISQSDKLCE